MDVESVGDRTADAVAADLHDLVAQPHHKLAGALADRHTIEQARRHTACQHGLALTEQVAAGICKVRPQHAEPAEAAQDPAAYGERQLLHLTLRRRADALELRQVAAGDSMPDAIGKDCMNMRV